MRRWLSSCANDHEDGSAARFDYGEGVFGSESPFARRVGADPEREDRSWVNRSKSLQNADSRSLERVPLLWDKCGTARGKGRLSRVPLSLAVGQRDKQPLGLASRCWMAWPVSLVRPYVIRGSAAK